MKTTIAICALGSALGCELVGAGSPAMAGDITGGSALLDANGQAQLERWLGAGEFNLDNVYTRHAGDTSADFHAAADDTGATFTLLALRNGAGARYLVGAYNPQSWNDDEGWHETERDWERTAFLFNMTTPAVYRQVLSDYVLPSQGLRQTFNASDFGPVFGAGPDLFVNDDLTTALSWQLGYGNPRNEGISIVDGSMNGQAVRVEGLEIFAITPVPEASAAWMALAGLGVLGSIAALARRRTG